MNVPGAKQKTTPTDLALNSFKFTILHLTWLVNAAQKPPTLPQPIDCPAVPPHHLPASPSSCLLSHPPSTNKDPAAKDTVRAAVLRRAHPQMPPSRLTTLNTFHAHLCLPYSAWTVLALCDSNSQGLRLCSTPTPKDNSPLYPAPAVFPSMLSHSWIKVQIQLLLLLIQK